VVHASKRLITSLVRITVFFLNFFLFQFNTSSIYTVFRLTSVLPTPDGEVPAAKLKNDYRPPWLGATTRVSLRSLSNQRVNMLIGGLGCQVRAFRSILWLLMFLWSCGVFDNF